ncbi:Zinc finger, RING-type [Penicillium italicum]|uniref:Zinc finger, RING-type n=1 Tax=Penicillium italicum TaxID=40296 RepID=A0A0A2K984_PENIT|nr:Zinc finger, RING-type [Penicillium italicum]
MSSSQTATEAQKNLSDPNLSALLPQSPTEDPVHLSKLNAGAEAHCQVKISEEVLSQDRHFESSLTSKALEISCQTTQSALSPVWPVGITVSGDACAICLDTMEDEIKVRGLPCDHAFHVNCVDKWLLWRRACCPVCRFACKITPKVT